MICTDIYINQFDWLVHCYFAVDSYYVDSILFALKQIGCYGRMYRRAAENLFSRKLDTGLTFTNKHKRESVLVVGLASSPAEYDNSIAHELRHLEDGIAQSSNMSLCGEDVAYLSGEIRKALHDITSALTCECKHRKDRIRKLKSFYTVDSFRRID